MKLPYVNYRILIVLLMGFSSGLPLLLVGSTLQAWYTTSNLSLLAIGSLSLIGQPYVYKFIWAPVFDRFSIGALGRRRGWIFLTQVGLILGLVGMAFINPQIHPMEMAALAFVVAIFSASQDIAIDAYSTELLNSGERAVGAAAKTLGPRLAMIVSGVFALIMAAEIGWQTTYLIMAGIMLVLSGITLMAPAVANETLQLPTLSRAIVEPLREILSRPQVIYIFLFIMTYKLCDALALSLNTPFFIRGLGFNLIEVGSILKTVGLGATFLGSLVAGFWMTRLGLFKALLWFGVLQALSNLSYMVLALVGKNFVVMIVSVFIEYFFSGLSVVAFVALLMSLCDQRYTATQFALFSALAAVARVYVGPFAAMMVDHMGWALFYLFASLIGLFPLLLLMHLNVRGTLAAHFDRLTLSSEIIKSG